MRQMAARLPRPGILPAVRASRSCQRRRAMPAMHADPAQRRPGMAPAPPGRPSRPADLHPARPARRQGCPTVTARPAQAPGPRHGARPWRRGCDTRALAVAAIPACRPATVRAPGRPGAGCPVRRPPRLVLRQRRRAGPAACAHPGRPWPAGGAHPARPRPRLDHGQPQRRRENTADPAGLGRRRRADPRSRHPGTGQTPCHHHPPRPAIPHPEQHGDPRPRPPWRGRRARRRPAHRGPARRHRTGDTPLGAGPARSGTAAAPAVPVHHHPLLPQLPAAGPGKLGRPCHQPEGDHWPGHPGRPRRPGAGHRPQPAVRAAQPVRRYQAGS
jgi:hypothetical protein